jgi:hypothetical protein
MAKASKIDAVVAEMQTEQRIVEACIDLIASGNSLEQYALTLRQCIARLSGNNGSEPAPKPARTRKGRKATEPSI